MLPLKILKYPFDTLWKLLWIHTETINYRIKNEYHKSLLLFNKLKEGFIVNTNKISLEQLISESPNTYDSNEWEIPKGRRSNKESNKECAIRECEEETNINRNDFEIIHNILPLTEEYIGINNVCYKHIYYIGIIKEEKEKELIINQENKEQYTEIKDIRWFTEIECLEHIRNYNKEKKKVIESLFYFLDNYEKYGILK